MACIWNQNWVECTLSAVDYKNENKNEPSKGAKGSRKEKAFYLVARPLIGGGG